MDRDRDIEILRRMLVIRRFEEMVAEVGAEFPGHRHLAAGQEAAAVAVAMVREAEDPVVSTHRNHGHNLALGADPGRLLAEFYGRSDGYAGGKSGSLHASVPELGLICSSAVVAAGVPIACGLAYAGRLRGTQRVAVCFFGNGALNEGAFHEAANIAGLWRLPVVLICENNSGECSGSASDLAVSEIVRFADVYGMAGDVVDGSDYPEVERALRAAFERARRGEGPTLVEVRTVPWPGTYRRWPRARPATPLLGPPLDEQDAAWAPHDVLRRWVRWLVATGRADPATVRTMEAAVATEMQDATAFARASEPPGPAAALTHVFAVAR